MGYTVPLTAVSNTALTAAQWNASMRDDMLETPAAKFTATGQMFISTGANAGAVRVPGSTFLGTLDTTASTAYTSALASTNGPAVGPLATGANALVHLRMDAVNSGAGASLGSFAVSGASTIAAADARSIGPDGTSKQRAGALMMMTTLTPGNNTFTMSFRVTSGTGSFANREMGVIPL
jgi:hypothetical protein